MTDAAPLPPPYTAVDGGLKISLRVAPKASRDAIGGLIERPDGGAALKVSVTAAPEDGKANQAVIELLAKAWRTPKSSFSVVVGATDRNKIVFVAGDPADLAQRLENALLTAKSKEKQR